MKLGTDGIQPHVLGSATPIDPFKRTTAGPLRKWPDRFTMEIKPSTESMPRRRWRTRFRK